MMKIFHFRQKNFFQYIQITIKASVCLFVCLRKNILKDSNNLFRNEAVANIVKKLVRNFRFVLLIFYYPALKFVVHYINNFGNNFYGQILEITKSLEKSRV